MMLNMSSRNTQPLVCPLMTMRHDDVVIWYKDGKPIPSDNDDTSTVHSTNTSEDLFDCSYHYRAAFS